MSPRGFLRRSYPCLAAGPLEARAARREEVRRDVADEPPAAGLAPGLPVERRHDRAPQVDVVERLDRGVERRPAVAAARDLDELTLAVRDRVAQLRGGRV